MIKITHNGFIIEVDSVKDAKEIIAGGEYKPRYSALSKTIFANGILANVARKKVQHFKHWTPAEIQIIFDSITAYTPNKIIVRNPVLREHHSVSAIYQQCNRVRSGKFLKGTSQRVRDMITDFRGNRIAINRT